MNKNQYWKIDSDVVMPVHEFTATERALKDAPTLDLFVFTVKRFKDINTHKEFLEISASVENAPSGTITTNLVKIGDDLLQLRAYGVVMPRQMFTELSRAISENYYKLEKTDIDESANIKNAITKDIVDNVLVMFAEYFGANDIAAVEVNGQELYNIPVKDFNEEIKDGAYKDYNPTDIKEALYTYGYTVVNKGRFDYVVSIDGKKIRVVSFKKDAIDSALDK